MNSVFLKAEWRNLILANYEFDRTILKKYLPAKTEFDSWNAGLPDGQGKDYVSLVGFLFKNTRLKGMAIPFHTTFEEVNLRFYVRHKINGEWRRGVVFIREIVPKRMITFVANNIYNENYVTRKMTHNWELSKKEKGESEKYDLWDVSYSWRNKNSENIISVRAENKTQEIAPGSGEEFITEHYYGYTKFDESQSAEYKVEHPRWRVYPVLEYNIKCDFEKNYGSDFKSLAEINPDSVYLAAGSEIKVYNKVIIR